MIGDGERVSEKQTGVGDVVDGEIKIGKSSGVDDITTRKAEERTRHWRRASVSDKVKNRQTKPTEAAKR